MFTKLSTSKIVELIRNASILRDAVQGNLA